MKSWLLASDAQDKVNTTLALADCLDEEYGQRPEFTSILRLAPRSFRIQEWVIYRDEYGSVFRKAYHSPGNKHLCYPFRALYCYTRANANTRDLVVAAEPATQRFLINQRVWIREAAPWNMGVVLRILPWEEMALVEMIDAGRHDMKKLLAPLCQLSDSVC